jgi:hypothetical protein
MAGRVKAGQVVSQHYTSPPTAGFCCRTGGNGSSRPGRRWWQQLLLQQRQKGKEAVMMTLSVEVSPLQKCIILLAVTMEVGGRGGGHGWAGGGRPGSIEAVGTIFQEKSRG